MLEEVYASPDVIARLRNGPLGEVVDGLAEFLGNRGHAHRTIQDYLRGVGHFGFWLETERIPVTKVNEKTVDLFMSDHLPNCRCMVPSGRPAHQIRAGVSHLLAELRRRGLIQPPPAPCLSDADRLVEAYRHYLQQVRGAAPKTCCLYAAHATAFLQATFDDGAIELARLSQGDLARFVVQRARVLQPGGGQKVASALRSFVRFLHVQGHCDAALVDAIPTLAARSAPGPRSALDPEQLSAFLGAFDHATRIGRRDYAMAVCMVDLALRSCEVSSIVLDDIDWAHGVLRVTGGKTRRAGSLPIPTRVGAAIVDYLKHGRPDSPDRRLFVRHAVPKGKALSPGAVRAAIRRAFSRADVASSSRGTHILRRTAATRMVRAGANLKDVADVLRHRSLDTTVLYIRTDEAALAAVAMPWPGRAR